MKHLAFKFGVAGTVLLAGGLAFLASQDQPITFESEESQTVDGDPVYNSITLTVQGNQDIWLMRQSHDGLRLPKEQWDRLAIIVDRSRSPARASFLQLEPGDQSLSPELLSRRSDYRASCFFCHPNGPRAIRPVDNSPMLGSLSMRDSIRIGLWNLRIKAYGLVAYDERHDEEDAVLAVPFRSVANIDNDVLTTTACARCHNDKGWFARGYLRRQNLPAIDHLTKGGHMPPPLFPMSNTDRRELERFMNGF